VLEKMDKRFENFTISVLKLYKLIQKIKLFEMKEYGLKAIHVMCIYYISQGEGNITAGELTKFSLEDKAAISRALALLRDNGYVTYDSTKYSSPIILTDEGKKIAEHVAEAAKSAVNAGGRELTDEQRTVFYYALDSIAKNLDKYYRELNSGEEQ
jgi:DNA-binding MarR family transcriptional regulator